MAAEPAALLIAPGSPPPVVPAKRRRSSGFLQSTTFKKPMAIEIPPRSPPMDARLGDHNAWSILNESHHTRSEDNHPSITLSASARLAGQTVAPFLAKHIPDQYAPLGGAEGQTEGPPNANNDTKYCYRHRPDSKCRRQADEPSMDQLQSQLETLTQADQQGIAHMWSLFSAAPSKQRELMLRGILTQCCFPQLSFISASVRDLIRIDFVTALPAEISFKILCYLDTTSLCKAAQVSQRWRGLADDDVVWHKMCEQHIDRKCTKCGWGLPLLERKRLRASKRQIQLRATGRGMNVWSPDITPFPESIVSSSRETSASVEPTGTSLEPDVLHAFNQNGKRAVAIPLYDQLELTRKRKKQEELKTSYFQPKFRPWKEVYKDRFKVCTNWKYGRCSTKIFRGHTNGVMCLQFDDKILATGSYDATIRIWNIDTGEEVRSLRGHTAGVRALQFDDTKLISGSLDKSLKVWNWHTGECISTYTGHTGGVISLNFDASILVSGSVDSTIKIWNFEDKSTFLLRGHTDWVNAVKLDSPSRTVFSASDDCTVRLWDLDTKACLRIFEGHVGQVQQVIPLPAEFELETAMRSPEVSTSIEIDPTPRQQFAEPFSVATERPLPPRYMLTSALDSTVRLWDVAAGRCIRTFFGHVEGVWALAADTLRVVSGAEDRMVKVWDARTGRCERTFTGHAGPVTCIGLSDSKMVTGSEDHEVRVYSFKPDGLVPIASGSTHTAGENML